MFATISIRTKISAVVAILLLVMSCMGALAIKQMYGINAATVDIASNWLPSIRTLSELRSATIAYRGVIRSHLLADDDAGRKVQDASIARYTDQIANARKEYEPLITSPEEQALYDEFAKYWSAYVAELVPVLEGSRKGADKAIRDLNLKATKTGMLASAALEKDVELNNRGALLASDRATQDFSLAIKLLIGSVVFAIIVGIVAAIMLVRDVSRGINSIIVPMQALGNGDLAATVPHQGEATEIGKMADTLQVFKLALIDKKAADEAASTDAEVKIERGRRVDGITRAFEAMIGDIVETVSSASNQLEASAGTLTSTAERSQELATAVAAASEEASTNVQSVASATEEMASSVNEINRQVQESATIASGPSNRRARPTTGSANWRRRPPGSGTLSNSSTPSPARPTCWH